MKISKKLRLIFSLTSLIVCMCMSLVTVGADMIDYSDFEAQETETTEDDMILYADGKVSKADLKSTVDTYVQQLTSISMISYEEILYLDEMYASQTDFYGSFAAVAGKEGCGTYAGYDNFNVVETEEKNVLKLTADVHFSEKDVKMILNTKVFDNLGVVVTSTEFVLADEGTTTIDEMMTEAISNTLMGMGTVFVVLILISLIISCFVFIPKIQAVFTKKEKPESGDSSESPSVTADVSDNAEMDDKELIAVIAAAIAASENTTTDSFVVRSIRKRRFS